MHIGGIKAQVIPRSGGYGYKNTSLSLCIYDGDVETELIYLYIRFYINHYAIIFICIFV